MDSKQVDFRKEDVIYKNILQNMTDGVMTVDTEGRIITFNEAAGRILEIKPADALDRNFGELFLAREGNDDFTETILSAVYESSVTHKRVVDYTTGTTDGTGTYGTTDTTGTINTDGSTDTSGNLVKTLAITTSYLMDHSHGEALKLGVIAVFSDVTEINELRDALKAMEMIKRLNEELGKRNKFIREVFGRYETDAVVDRLIETPEGLDLGGKKQGITILMSDLRGFTTLSEQLRPEMVVSMINNYLGVMTDVILRHNGTINEFIGDAILIFFGAPVETPDHAEKAIACAVDMQLAMRQVNEWNRVHGFPELSMGIGINTGDVVIGNIGSSRRAKYGAVGKNINLASRIESYTIGGQILVSESTLQHAGEGVKVKSFSVVEPKGIKKPITIYDVYGIGDSVLPIAVEQLHPLTESLTLYFNVIEGKHNDTASDSGVVLEIGKTVMILRSQSVLDKMDNLRMMVADSHLSLENEYFYAKVIEVLEAPGTGGNEGGRYKLGYSSLPGKVRECFDKYAGMVDRG
ncbi:MAG: PAS domain-containing protein [Nitrospirae bacterium]|nr:PAS domain-containing protein [Nitrospirota bacterium]